LTLVREAAADCVTAACIGPADIMGVLSISVSTRFSVSARSSRVSVGAATGHPFSHWYPAHA
jgi:hypothetical protein